MNTKTPILSIIIAVLIFTACKKKNTINPTPILENNTILTEYTNPLNISLESDKRFVDIDKDGLNDIVFKLSVSTENQYKSYYYVAEPLREEVEIVNTNLIDAYSYLKSSEIYNLSVNDIPKRWTSSQGILLEKLVFTNNIQRIGMFNGSQALYLGIRIKKNQNFQYGWIEIKHQIVSDLDQIQISKAGISKINSHSIKAGN